MAVLVYIYIYIHRTYMQYWLYVSIAIQWCFPDAVHVKQNH